MTTTTGNPTPSPDTTPAEMPHQSSFITPEIIEKNPILAVAGVFADDPYWEELMAEIKKERVRQRRREARQTK